ncbi:MAG: hypothetical protein J2O44_07765 [Porphyrobacter sp.]|nr:hypothetical protein [Porphyrobacter sp.]
MTGLVGLCRIDLPAATVRLCDGGFIPWGADTYKSADPVFGTIGSMKELTEGVGDEVPSLELTLLPAAAAAPGDLSQPGFQRSLVRFWIGEYDRAAGTLIGDPDLLFYGQIDQTTLKVGSTREVAMSVVSTAERFFELNIGNSLSDAFHQSVWPGELGEANATGLAVPVAWGVEAPPRN